MQNQNKNIKGSGFLIKSTSDIKLISSQIGQKAIGLFNCNLIHVPPFIVLSSDLFNLWIKDEKNALKYLESKKSEINSFFKDDYLIIRSSAHIESFTERGFYISSDTKVGANNLINEIVKIWNLNKRLVNSIKNNDFSLIIQKYITSKFQGHLSNERRISPSETSWFYEIMNSNDVFQESDRFKISNFSTSNLKNEKEYSCNNHISLVNSLKKIAKDNSDNRYHIEWVWDGKQIWIVQRDIDNREIPDTLPGSKWKEKNLRINTPISQFNIVKTIENTLYEWKKINCIKTFIKCDLPRGNVFIIEGKKLLDEIFNNNLSENLYKELEKILNFPVVIRMDIRNEQDENFLLPRTAMSLS